MLLGICLALICGLLISLTRAANGQVGMSLGAFKASYWNHIVGFAFLTLLLVLSSGFVWEQAAQAPWYVYLGGVLGTFFVAINSYVIPRLGVTKTALLVISGQMLVSVLISNYNGSFVTLSMQLVGVGLILLGVYWGQKYRQPT
ncbi:MAG: DMT family transporter [Thiothrix sp.]|nr:MAG: DMT family transporter [Thiothrix sp.]